MDTIEKVHVQGAFIQGITFVERFLQDAVERGRQAEQDLKNQEQE